MRLSILCACLCAFSSHALTIEYSTNLTAAFDSTRPTSGGTLWQFNQFDPSLGILTSVSIHATIVNKFSTTEFNPFSEPRNHTPGMSWSTSASFFIQDGRGGFPTWLDYLSVEGEPRVLQRHEWSVKLSGTVTNEINGTLTEHLNRFYGSGVAFLLLHDQISFYESWGLSHAALTFDLRIVYEFEPAVHARPIWIITVHGTAGWEYNLLKRESYETPDIFHQWGYYLATTNGSVEFIDWNTKSHFGAYAVQPRRVSGNSDLIQPALTARQRMRVEIQSDFTNLVTVSRAFNSLDFKPWLTLTNPPGKTSVIDEDFEERIPMPWQSGVATTNSSRFYRVIQSKL